MGDVYTALAYTIGYGVAGYGAEGGESNDPSDPGGFTWRGITLANWQAWTANPNATATDLLQATEDQIVAFYAANYWNRVQGDPLPEGVSLSVFDMAVNAGDYASATILQTVIGFTGADVDGWIGPQTEAAAAKIAPATLIAELATAQLSYYQQMSDWATFGDGWTNRVNGRKAAALAAIGESS